MCQEEFDAKLHRIIDLSLPAREIVQQAFDKRFEFHKSGQFIFLETLCPWKEHLGYIEKK